jgi:hypothetical protein
LEEEVKRLSSKLYKFLALGLMIPIQPKRDLEFHLANAVESTVLLAEARAHRALECTTLTKLQRETNQVVLSG